MFATDAFLIAFLYKHSRKFKPAFLCKEIRNESITCVKFELNRGNKECMLQHVSMEYA